MKFFKFINILSVSLALLYSNGIMAAAGSCAKEKKEFRELYIKLQQDLNYEGKDAYLDKGVLKLKKHSEGTNYEGKIFEDALFKEYQNTLRKVAKVYQSTKFESPSTDISSNPELVNFMKSIESTDNEKYIKDSDINTVIDTLAAQSEKNEKNKKFIINNNDKYLLKKLLTHAQDRICSVDAFIKSGGKRTKLFDADYLKQVKNAPLNRLITTIRDAKIGKDSNLELVNENTAINSAILADMENLRKWMSNHAAACFKAIQNPAFIQANIQSCNYRSFLKDLQATTLENDVSSILHFINANERLLKRGQAKAETALDELKLEAAIDQTFKGMTDRVSCSIIGEKNGKSKLFVRNLKYDSATNKFDTKEIECKVKNTILSEAQCAKKLEMISDPLGRGLEIRQKIKTGAPVLFSVKSNPNCIDIEAPAPPVVPPPTIPPVPPTALPNDKDKCLAGNIIAENAPLFSWDAEKNICKNEKTECKEPKIWDDKLGCKEKEKEKEKTDEEKKCLAGNSIPENSPLFSWDAEKHICKDEKAECKEPKVWDDKLGCKDKEKEKEKEKVECKEDQILNDKNVCVSKPAKEKCLVDDTGRELSKTEKKECMNSKNDSGEEDGDLPDMKANTIYPNKAVPGRFTPINIPTRQPFILPGMP